ncbi:hypothetical protein POM88_042338 [Heracleum sosnowskyi]|uniref:K+ potassium transporter integral membrane domain-containing protein n=1 Tax=Heracleum sosnowskyi TaxID=360622 RepID=A0AAD8HIE7_9APIA|nr:hypothetical protein POM88_042338 [Heracleum sosnowskyi]
MNKPVFIFVGFDFHHSFNWFRDTKCLGNASGLAVITVMLVTTCLMSLVIVLCWHRSVFLEICFVVFFGIIEALYFSDSLNKFLEGAWGSYCPCTYLRGNHVCLAFWHPKKARV